MPRYACPVCGDPNAYLFWVDPEPPEGCPHEDHENWGTTRAIKNVSECAVQRKKSWQAAEFRKLVPDAFDETGKMKAGQLARVLQAFGEKCPGKPIEIG